MKSIIFAVITLFVLESINAQDRKFSISFEYSPHFSKLTNEIVDEKFKPSHNLLLRLKYKTKYKIRPTIGIGMLNTGMLIVEKRDRMTSINGAPPILVSEVNRNYHSFNYLVLPLGAKINFNNYYLISELAMGINFTNQIVTWTTESTGDLTLDWQEQILNNGEFNRISLPLSIGIGRNYTIGNMKLSAGIKSYVSLNQLTRNTPRNTRFYGIGLLMATHF
jgi:hypothetical protein